VEVHKVVRAIDAPCYHGTGNCRPKIENLCCCGRCYRDVDKFTPTDTRGDGEDDECGNPSTIFIPSEEQGNAEAVITQERGQYAPVENLDATKGYLSNEVIKNTWGPGQGTFTDKEGGRRYYYYSNTSEICEIHKR
jgi:hypothetical protein